MSKSRVIILLFLFSFLQACSAEKQATTVLTDTRSSGTTHGKNENIGASKYLAYEHSVVVEVGNELLQPMHNKVVERCFADEEFQCVVLDSSIQVGGDYASGRVKLRLLPQGVPSYLEMLTSEGNVVSNSSKAEDLSDVVVENQKRLDMLKKYRDRLQELEATEGGDIESLLKIASEMASVQNQLEYALGKEQKLIKRVDNDLLNIEFRVAHVSSKWGLIRDSFDSFGDEMTYAISAVISFTASFIPWLPVIVFLLWLFRWIWGFFRRKRS